MISAIWIFALFALAGIVFFVQKLSPASELAFRIRSAILSPTRDGAWALILLFLAIIFFPLVVGLDFFLKTDANVLVVIFFLFWLYQWIKIIWNSTEKIP
ncbi:MAG: hypothetical protein JJT78_12745 [Leptospira sp.]|nr:hypothetical protein [Leptospira sp.]